jgi:rare lipoprotein A
MCWVWRAPLALVAAPVIPQLGAGRRLGPLAGVLVLLLAGCASNPSGGDGEVAAGDDVVPKFEPKSRQGNMDSYVVFGKRYYTKASSRGHVERGLASWYGRKFHGRKTSNGERYDMHKMSAAHKTLPLPTYAMVTNLENGRRAVVRVNDRGPFVGNRIIDLSYAAAKRLDMVNAGTARVEVRSIDPRDHGGDHKAALRMASADIKPSSGARSDVDHGAPARVVTASAAAAGQPIYLQVGAFGSRGNAEQLKKQLRSAVDRPVRVRAVRTETTGDPLYKVQVGPLGSAADAGRLERRLGVLGVSTPLLVVR